MNVTVKIFYSDNEFTPALYFCDWRCAWQLWFTLTHSMVSGESGPHVVKVQLWDCDTQLDPSKGLAGMAAMTQQYRKE